MKRLVFVSIVIFSFAFSIFAQNIPCPTISAMGPSSITPIGGSMTFIVNVTGMGSDKLKYQWSVTAGTITIGQGTPVITVDTNADLAGQTITATVEITGLPQNCPNVSSASGEIPFGCGLVFPRKIDEFSVTPPRIRKERFELIKIELANNPQDLAYVIESFKSGTSPELIKKKLANIFSFLIKISKIPPERLVIRVSEGNETLTEVWIVPPGVEVPDEIKEGVEIKGNDFQNQVDKLFPKSKKKSLGKVGKKI